MSQISKFKVITLASAVAALGWMAPSYAQDQPEKAKRGDTIAYVSGGVAEDSRDRMNSMARDFNLKLVFTLNEGNYLASVPVRITDSRGRVVVEDVSEGPFFMAKLPAGTYTVTATNDGKTQTRRVQVGNGLRTEHLRWPASATDNPLPREQASRGSAIETGSAN
jgi:hypothetical protein